MSVPMGWLLSPSYIWEVILGRSLSDSIVITYKIFQFFQNRAGCGTDESSSLLPLCPRLVSGAGFCVSRRWSENRWLWLEWDSAQQSCGEVSVGDQGWVSEDPGGVPAVQLRDLKTPPLTRLTHNSPVLAQLSAGHSWNL